MEHGVYGEFTGDAVQLARHRRDQFSALLSRRCRSAAAVNTDALSSGGGVIKRRDALRRIR